MFVDDANDNVDSILHFTTFVIACYETNKRNRLAGPMMLIMQSPGNGTAPFGQMQPVTGGQAYFQVLPAGNGMPQQQVYYVPVQAMPNGQVASQQTVLVPPMPAVVAGNGMTTEQEQKRYM